jgi:hypothetical protein
MLMARIILLTSLAFGALVVCEPASAALPSHDPVRHAYDDNVNVPYGPRSVIKPEGTYAVAGRIVRCPWRRGCF